MRTAGLVATAVLAVASDLPDVFTNLSPEQSAAIKALPSSQIWADGRGISVEPLHRGFVFNNPVGLYLVEEGAAWADSAKAVALYARAVADAVLEGKANATSEVVQAAAGGDEFVEINEEA